MQTQMTVIGLLRKRPLSDDTNDLYSTVVTLLIVNSDGFSPAAYDSVFKSVGLDRLSFLPQSRTIALSAWPTLQDMLSTNQRLVTFLDNGADFTAVPYLIDGGTAWHLVAALIVV
jgi:hypothetical protein